MIKKISAVVGCILGLSALFGVVYKYDATIVKAEDLAPMQQSIQKLNRRIDRSDLEQARRDYQRRIWMLEDRYGTVAQMPVGIKEEYRCLVRDLQTTEEHIKRLGGGN